MLATAHHYLPHGAVVAGFDDSPSAWHAVRWAAGEATRRALPLLIAHASGEHWPATSFAAPTAIPFSFGAALDENLAWAELEKACREVRHAQPDLDVRTALLHDIPAAGLAELAETTEAPLLVIGASEAGDLSRTLTGSTASDLARMTRRPLVVIREEPLPPFGADSVPVVVGVDQTADSSRALEFAVDFAHRHATTVHIVHAWPERGLGAILPALRPSDPAGSAPRAAVTTSLGEQLDDLHMSYPGVPVERESVRSRPAEALITQASDCALLVLGYHGRGPFHRVLRGSINPAVLHQAPCPVAVVRAA